MERAGIEILAILDEVRGTQQAGIVKLRRSPAPHPVLIVFAPALALALILIFFLLLSTIVLASARCGRERAAIAVPALAPAQSAHHQRHGAAAFRDFL